jgi:hypothetical protein
LLENDDHPTRPAMQKLHVVLVVGARAELVTLVAHAAQQLDLVVAYCTAADAAVMARQTRPVAVVVGEEDMALGTAEFEAFAKSVGPRLVVLPHASDDAERLTAVLGRILANDPTVPIKAGAGRGPR